MLDKIGMICYFVGLALVLIGFLLVVMDSCW